MRRKKIRVSWILSMFGLSVCLFGCANDEDNKIDLVGIKVDKSGPFYMVVSETQEVSATPVPLNTTETASVVWESSASSVATVSNAGLITAVGAGEAVIKAALGGFKQEITVYVSLTSWEVPVTDIRLSDAGPLRIPVNNTVQISATPEPVNTTNVSPFRWSSGDEAIATVSDEGLITAVAVGKTTITVSKGDISKEISVTVVGLDRVVSWLLADPSNPLKATVGRDFIPYKMNGNRTTGTPDPALGGFSVLTDGPNGTSALRVPKQSYLFCNHGIEPLSGDYVNEYTILIQFRLPAETRASFFQTDLTNQNDVDCFLRNNMYQIGMVGFYADLSPAIAANTWYRLVISAKLGEGGWFQYYLNGTQIYDLHGGSFGTSGRAALNSEGAWHKDGLMLCADEDGEDEIMDVAEIGIWEVALTEEQVATIVYK